MHRINLTRQPERANRLFVILGFLVVAFPWVSGYALYRIVAAILR